MIVGLHEMKQFSTKIIILGRINYGEADRILNVITPDHGKLSLLAKGVRRSKSKLAGGLELFSISNVTFIDGKSEIKTVISTQLDRYFSKIVENIESTKLAYDFLKKIDKYTKESCDEQYFNLLISGLESLHIHDKNTEIINVWFLSQLLKLHGSAINVDTTANKLPFDENSNYEFNYDEMAFFARKDGRFEPKHIKFLRLLLKVNSPENLINIEGSQDIAVRLKGLLDNCYRLEY